MDITQLKSALDTEPLLYLFPIVLCAVGALFADWLGGRLYPPKRKLARPRFGRSAGPRPRVSQKTMSSTPPNDGSAASAMMWAGQDEPRPKLGKELDIDYHDSSSDSSSDGD